MRDYLYNLSMVDLLMIERGYHRRNIGMWSAARWSTYHIMLAFVGDGLKKQGIHSPKDLLPLPWDEETTYTLPDEQYTEEDIRELQADIDFANSGALKW